MHAHISRDSPIAIAVFAASFFIVLIPLLALNAQSKVRRLVLRMYCASPLVRLRYTQRWKDGFVRWYQRGRSARTCVWIKDDNVGLSFPYHSGFLRVLIGG